jgi:fumarate reductase subunit C
MVTWLHYFWAMVRQNIMVGTTWQSKAGHLVVASKQRDNKGQGQVTFTAHPMTYILQLVALQ